MFSFPKFQIEAVDALQSYFLTPRITILKRYVSFSLSNCEANISKNAYLKENYNLLTLMKYSLNSILFI